MLEGKNNCTFCIYKQTVYTNSHRIYIYTFIQFTKRFSQYTHVNMNTITRFSRTSNITLSALGAIAGISAGFSQARLQPETRIITAEEAAALKPGLHPLLGINSNDR